MDNNELTQHLKTLQTDLSNVDFLNVILERLDKNPPRAERSLLEAWLMVCAVYDPDGVAKYWEPILYGEDPFQGEVAALKLSALARLKPSGLAYRLLAEYLGQEPAEDKIRDILKLRFQRLFPGHEEDQ